LHQADFMMVGRMRALPIAAIHGDQTIAMIFTPFPRFVAPISAPPPLAITNVASMKHSSSSSAPLSQSSLASAALSRGSVDAWVVWDPYLR